MDYSKHFSGNVSAGSSAAAKFLNKDGTLSTVALDSALAINKSSVVGEAIVNTLKDCGLSNAKYYGSVGSGYTSYVCLDDTKAGKPGFYIWQSGNYVYSSIGYNNGEDDIIRCLTSSVTGICIKNSISTSNFPFASTGALVASAYNFYINIKGDTKGLFHVGVSAYNGTTPSWYPIVVVNSKNEYNNREVYGFCMAQSIDNLTTHGYVFVYKDTCVNIAGAVSTLTSSNQYSFLNNAANGVSNLDNVVPIVDLVLATYPHIHALNVYIGCANLDIKSYYNIDNAVYYNASKYYMLKMLTTVSPT